MKRLFSLAILALPLAAAPASQANTSSLPNPIVMVIVLGALSLAPFVLIMLTSFVKISVVLSILRNALGTQSAPPNQVITGLALILSIFVMSPVVSSMYSDAGAVADSREMFSEGSIKSLFEAINRGKEPLRRFLERHAHDPDRLLFLELANRISKSNAAPEQANSPSPSAAGKDDFQILIPAFVTSQLKEAFQVGFLVFVPFIVIDMVIANVLLAMGMSMLSPSVISLPFKLLLFILVDGWYLLVRGLVLSYA